MQNSEQNLFFILGCQRTGTTLMRLIFESHSQISVIDEPYCYAALSDLSGHLKKNPKKGLLGFKSPVITEQMDKSFFSDASLNFVIINKFKNFPQVFMIRDVRDTIASMMSLKQDGSTWYDMWPLKSIDFWKYTIPDFATEFADDLEILSNSKDKLVSAASFYWKYKTLSYFNYEKNGSKVCKIYYEDLVSKPKETITNAMKFLDIGWEDSLLTHHKIKHEFTDRKGITVGDTNTTLPIFNDSIGRFTTSLSESQVENILQISGKLMRDLGYKI